MKKIFISLLLVVSLSNLYSSSIDNDKKDISLNVLMDEVKQNIDKSLIPDPQKDFERSKALDSDQRYFLRISASDKYDRTKLLELGFDIINISKNYVEGFIHRDLLPNISEKDFTILDKKTISEWATINKDFPSSDAAYHNYKETYDVLKSIADKNPDVVSLYSIGKTVENRDIWCLRINSNAKGDAQSKKPGILLVGNHHAREHLSNEMVLLFAVYLLENRNDEVIKKYIDSLDIYIIPMLNPDGSEYDIATGSYRYWRKNTNKYGGSSPVGADLNRNYDFDWCKYGSSSSQNADTYCGKTAFSEPETKALRDFSKNHKNIKTALSYHSYSSLVLYPWGGRDEDVSDANDKNAFIKHANAMGKILNYEAEKSSELYLASGDMCDWIYDQLKVLAFTIELEGRGFYPGSAMIDKAFDTNKKAALYLMSVTANPYN
jgi:carboxypeptidase T